MMEEEGGSVVLMTMKMGKVGESCEADGDGSVLRHKSDEEKRRREGEKEGAG